jgi:hypothetical protein
VVQRGQAQVIMHIDATTGTARLKGGPEIPTTTAERLACDARVQALLDDRDGNRLYLGRARRLATPSQIAALTARDGERCQFPGCTHTRYLHAHHIHHWLRGGPTDIDNLILVCSFHHRVIHDHGYTIRRLPGRWQFRRPDGTPLPSTAAPLTGRAEALIEANTRARLRIDQATLTPTGTANGSTPHRSWTPCCPATSPRRPDQHRRCVPRNAPGSAPSTDRDHEQSTAHRPRRSRQGACPSRGRPPTRTHECPAVRPPDPSPRARSAS